MSGRLRYRDAITHTERRTEKIKNLIPGILGFTIKGKNVVEVDPRPGYVYVRIRDNFSEVVQAYNGVVSPVYGLPVLLIRDDKDQNKYKIYGRDTGRYANWGTTSAYLPKHGSTHSFNPKAPGYDPTWVWGRQMMPLAATPSGSLGAPNVIIQEGVYWQNATWNVAGATGTANIAPTYNPTGSSARMVLVYIDANNTPQLLAGSTFFASTITGTSQVLPYLPGVPDTLSLPIAGIRLVSGTSTIQWDNIYDVRPWMVGSGYIPTGTSNVEQAIFTVEGALTTGAGVIRIPNHSGRNFTISNVYLDINTPPTGTTIIIDIHKDGTTIFTDQNHRPTIAQNAQSGNTADIDVSSWANGSYLTMDRDQVGSSVAGSNLTVTVVYH